MQLPQLAPNGKPWNERVLHALGADTIAWPENEGPIVEPEISLANYLIMETEAAKAALRAYAAAVRYAKEISGATVNGVVFASDREAQSKMAAAFLLAQLNPATEFEWKLADGSFQKLSAANLEVVAAAVGAFVQSCFSTEAEIVAAVDTGTIMTTEQVDAAFA